MASTDLNPFKSTWKIELKNILLGIFLMVSCGGLILGFAFYGVTGQLFLLLITAPCFALALYLGFRYYGDQSEPD